MPNNCLSVLYKRIIQVENKNVGLKVGGHKHTIAPPINKVGGTCPPCPPPPLPTPVYIYIYIYIYIYTSDIDITVNKNFIVQFPIPILIYFGVFLW